MLPWLSIEMLEGRIKDLEKRVAELEAELKKLQPLPDRTCIRCLHKATADATHCPNCGWALQ